MPDVVTFGLSAIRFAVMNRVAFVPYQNAALKKLLRKPAYTRLAERALLASLPRVRMLRVALVLHWGSGQ